MSLAFERRIGQSSTYMDVVRDIADTRLKALSSMPFLFSEFAELHIVVTRSIPTAGITKDYKKLVINPDFWSRIRYSQDDKLAVLFHELLHKLFRHGERGVGKDGTLWNMACDAFINKFVKLRLGERNIVIRDGVTIESIYNAISPILEKMNIGLADMMRMNEEELYNLLTSIANKVRGCTTDHGSGRCPSEISGVANDLKDEMEKAERNSDLNIDDGTAESGKVAEIPPMVRQTDKVQRSQVEVVEKVRKEISRVIQPGESPGYIDEIFESVEPKPRLAWRSLLSQILARESGRTVVETWKRPSRRFEGMPGVRRLGPKSLNTVFLIDVSGSIDSDLLRRFVEESLGAVRDAGLDPNRCTVVFWDAAVQSTKTLAEIGSAGKVAVSGRGGTVIDPALEYAYRLRPDVVVVLTDGIVETSETTRRLADSLLNSSKVSIFVYTVEVPNEFDRWMKIKYIGGQ